jgi:hydroxymethylpyrimidine pyrophosphatase-like HAD family hydrolase
MPESHPIPALHTSALAASVLARARVLYTDVDGTLLGRAACLIADGDGRPNLDAVTAAAALNDAEKHVVIVSGRNARQLREMSRLLGWPDFIGEVGCVRGYGRGARLVYDTGGWPEGATLPGETPHDAIARVGALELLQKAFPGRIEPHTPWHLDREVTHMLRGNVPADEAQALLDTLQLPVTFVDNGIIHPPRHTLVGVTEIHAIHLVPTGTSKERAVALDLAERGLLAADALAIGDSAADVAMALEVGLLTVVSNGLADSVLLQRAAGYDNIVVTHASHGSGWAELANAWLAATAS